MKTELFLWRGDTYQIDSIIKSSSGISYEVEERLGRGGNGVVHKCTNQSTGDEYAIKFLLKYDKSDKRRRRFDHECEKLKDLDHPHIVRHIVSGRTPSKRNNQGRKSNKPVDYLIMDYADGGDLKGFLATNPLIEPEIYKAQFRGLADALRHIHGQGLLHRDIKPENVIIIAGRWVLSDFGLCAPLNRAGRDLTGDENLGPRFWMSPEMINRSLGIKTHYSKIDKPSDVFQLASVFWFAVNRRHPTGALVSSDWGGEISLCEVARRALDYCPKRRIQNGEDFYAELLSAIEG